MNVYVEPTNRRIAPFGDAPDDVLIANRPLREWRAQAFTEAGLTEVGAPTPPCLIVPDTLYTTGPVLQRFLAGAGNQNAVLVLAESRFGTNTHYVQPGVSAVDSGFRFEAVRFVSGGSEPVTEIVVDPEEETFDLDLPAQFGGATTIALPRHPVMTLHHWVHILWANQAAGASEVRRQPRWKGILAVIWAILRARSLNKWKVLAKLNTIGKGCDIHPTAVIEGSTLGDGVTVGPYARILFSRVGDNATIMSGAEVEVSTIGAGATVAQRAGVRMAVLYPGAFASQILYQAGVMGENALAVPASYCIDHNFDRNIRVPLDGELWDTGTRFLGSAIGHRARIATGLWFASGRAIPNDAFVIRHPDKVITRIPETAADGPMVVREGRLEPLA
ncbi:MAG: hypothetical protein EP330_28400 [Deltaproteobacteria bacterium]|nr:MAG: hypothetical protein EP330_28400 [Deltaproteobacteria bacterium]